MFIKQDGLWKAVNDIFIRVDGVWKQIQNAFIVVGGVWKQFFGDNAPVVVTKPSIRTTNTSGSGTIYDGPVASSPQTLNTDLFGKDGTYTNYTSISGRKFTYASTSDASSRNTLINDDRFTSAGGVTTAMRSTVDDQYLFYELTVSNGTDPLDQIQPVSNPIKMIKDYPNVNTFGWTGAEEVGTQLAFNYNLSNYYYNSVEAGSSYIRWWRSTSTNATGTLIKQETISSTTTSSSSTSLSGTSYYTPTSSDIGYYVVAEIIAVSSYTRYYGYTDNYSLATYPTSNPLSSAITISNGRIEDTNGNRGLDNRYDLPVGALMAVKATVSGVNSSTSYRIRYRMYNWQNGTYYNFLTGATGSASSVWTTYTADGNGSGNISSVIISGGTAQITDYITVDASLFGSTTYSGGQYRWQIEIELSAIKTGGTRVYWVNPYQSYYIQPSANSTISASPSTINSGSSTTISGSFSGYPSGTAYPYQYKVSYGDGTDSGWLPVGGYSYGTGNPSYSLSKTYSSIGTYYPSVTTIPYYTSNSTTVTVANNLTTPTIQSVTSSGPGNAVDVVVSGGGPTYQMYWSASPSAPSNTVTPDGFATASGGSTTTITDLSGPLSTGTYYMYVRSASSTSTYGSSYTTAPSQYISSWSPYTLFVVSTTRYLSYNANGGTGAPSTTSGTDSGSGWSTTVSYTTPTRSGYTFNGWNTNSSGTGTNYSAGSSITLTSDITLYAKWVASNLTAPTISSISGSAGSINVYFSGGSGPYYQVYWYSTNRSDIQSVTSYDANGSSSPVNVTNLVAPTSGYTYYFWIRSVSSLTNTGTGPSTTISSWSSSSTWTAPVIAPSGGSVTLSGSSTPGSVITASTSGWSNSPTSYDVFITTSTSGTPTASSTRVASSNGSSSTSYTITSTDAISPANIFRSFATASNSGGTSGTVQSPNTITATSGVSIPATPTGVGLTGSGVVSWTASSGATSYEIQFYTAQNSSGLNAAGPYTVTGISGSPYQLVSPYAYPNNYARVQVRARNSAGASSYSAWVPSSTTYT